MRSNFLCFHKWLLLILLFCLCERPMPTMAQEPIATEYSLVLPASAIADPQDTARKAWAVEKNHILFHFPSVFLRQSVLTALQPLEVGTQGTLLFSGEQGNFLAPLSGALFSSPDIVGSSVSDITYTVTNTATGSVFLGWRLPQGAEQQARITIRFTVTRPVIGALRLFVASKTTGLPDNPVPETQMRTCDATLRQARDAQEMPFASLTPAEEAIPVHLVYTSADLQDAAGKPRPEEEARRALMRVAWLTFARARNGIKLGGPTPAIAIGQPSPYPDQLVSPDQPLFADVKVPSPYALDTALSQAFRLPGEADSANKRFHLTLLDTSSPDDPDVGRKPHVWELHVEEVPLLGPITLQAPSTRNGFPIARSVQEQARQVLRTVEAERAALDVETTPGEYGWPRHKRFKRLLETRYNVASMEVKVSDDPLPTVNANIYLGEVQQQLTGGAGLGYNIEEGLFGTLQLEGNNLLLRQETIALNFKGGDQAQKADLTVHAGRAGSYAGSDLDLSGLYLRDVNQRFGNPAGSRIEDRESGSLVRYRFYYDSFSESSRANFENGFRAPTVKAAVPRRWRAFTALETGLEYRDVDLLARSLALPGQNHSQLTAYSLSLSETLSQAPRWSRFTRVSYLETVFSGSLQSGIRALSGDYEYARLDAGLQTTLFFGGADRRRDLFLRYRQGFASGSGGTPIFRLPRIGGADTIRGIENGEFVGRNAAYRQFEIGVGFPYLGRVFARPSRQHPSASAPTNAPNAPPNAPDFSNAYLKLFYDVGRILPGARLGDLIGVGSGLEGYGISVEFARLPVGRRVAGLSLGYAYSPDSQLHRSGVFFTGIALSY